MQDGCKVNLGSSYTAWIMFCGHLDYFQKPPLGGRLNTKIMALRTLTTVGLFYFIMHEDPHEQKFIEIAFG